MEFERGNSAFSIFSSMNQWGMLMFKIAFSLFSIINQTPCSLSVEQPISFRLSVVYASMGISNAIEENSYVIMPHLTKQ